MSDDAKGYGPSVIKDRRARDRRTAHQPVPCERRRGERRSSPEARAPLVGASRPDAGATRSATPPQASAPELGRPRVEGKFLFRGSDKLWVRGVTYGTFRPDENGNEFPDPEVVERDFAQMAANGLNAVRTYTAPPRSLLDTAQRHGLHVMVGLAAERYVGYLTDRKGAPDVEKLIRAQVRACAGHPALLCYAIGNEIPASPVRWLGHRRVERYLERLCRAVRDEDPGSLVTYVNYPTTEYLQLPFLDLLCFNVYLESTERLDAYLARLHNLAGERPLIMAEIGLDSCRHGEDAQARVLHEQIRTAFGAGCAGAFVYAWTDEWHRAGADVEDWAFGLTSRDRRPKPALAAVRDAFSEVPFPKGLSWPRISVVVCSHNGARIIRDCLEGLPRLEYPNYEVIVVDDGSSDATATLARAYGFRVISTEHRGLSNARNTGWAAATGEIVAYIDDDAWPDPDWLTYLATTFMRTEDVGVGGPNIAPPGNGAVADCVANAPGGPVHVLRSDREAEHIPGCNMAFRRDALEAIGGFDPRFRTAGDDVDVCWRLQERGWTLGFSPAAMVWHHRRNSVRAYWRQQRGYGAAEAMLERKWPEKYNVYGHMTWAGRLYGRGIPATLGWRKGRIYQGTWGSALFQSLYQAAPNTIGSLPLMPDWYLVIATLASLSALGVLWRPLLLALPMLGIALGASVVHACLGASRASFKSGPRSHAERLTLRSLTALLHVVQPMARLWGRLRHGLSPWRLRGAPGFTVPRSRSFAFWSERWRSADERLRSLEARLRADGACVLRGGDYDRWDLEVRVGSLGAARIRMAIEEHGAGRQLVRFRSWPRCSSGGLVLTLLLATLAAGAAFNTAWSAGGILGVLAFLPAFRALRECARAIAGSLRALAQEGPGEA